MKPLRANIIVLTAFFILALVFTFPLILHFGNRVLGGMDANYFIWQNWWFKKAIFELHQSPFSWTDYLFYPDGFKLGNGYDGLIFPLLSLPLQFLFSPTVTYNLLAVLSYILAGFFTYSLINGLIKDHPLSFLGGTVFAFSPYMIARGYAGHANLLSIWTIPLFIHLFLKMGKEVSYKSVLLAAAALSLVALASWQYLIMTVIFIIFLKVFEGLSKLNRRLIFNHLLFVLLSAIFILPAAIPMLGGVLSHETTKPQFSEYLVGSANFLGYLVPPPFNSVGNNLGQKIYPLIPRFNDFEAAVFPGYLEIIFFLSVFYQIWKKKPIESSVKLWFFLAAIFFILSLGPTLLIADKPLLPLPYLLILPFPVLNLIRVTARFNAVFMLCLALIISLKLRDFLKSNPRRLLWLTLVFAVVLVERLALPFPLLKEPASDFFQSLGKDQEDYAVLNLPFRETDTNAIANYTQILHNKKIVGGYSTARSRDVKTYTFIENQPSLRGLSCQRFTEKEDAQILQKPGPSGFFNSLGKNNIRWVVIFKQLLNSDACKEYKDIINGFFIGRPIIFEDGEIRVYKTD